jgi:hypothetical protein
VFRLIIQYPFDKFGLMAIACRDEYRVKLFHSNGTDTSKIFLCSVEVSDVQFDSKGHFVVSLKNWTSHIFVFFLIYDVNF